MPYGGYSYEQLMIDTLAEALSETITSETHVEMALSGEMGSSLFRYPQSYLAIIDRLRARPKLKQLKIGISLNHGGIAGHNNPIGVPDITLSDADRQSLQELIDTCNFVGMSFYRPVDVNPTTADFVRGIDHYMSEFEEFGLNVPTSKPMQFSEVGIGGGDVDDGAIPDLAKAAAAPWEGTTNPRSNPWRDPSLRCKPSVASITARCSSSWTSSRHGGQYQPHSSGAWARGTLRACRTPRSWTRKSKRPLSITT